MIIRDPIDPHRADRWDRGFVTKEALCRADPDPWEPQGSNPPGPRGPELPESPQGESAHGGRFFERKRGIDDWLDTEASAQISRGLCEGATTTVVLIISDPLTGPDG